MSPKPFDLTRGSVSRGLFHLALPLMGSMFLETAFNLLNAAWVGQTGTESLAAVNLSSFPIWMLFAVVGIVTTGTNALVAQRLGAARNDPRALEEARRVAALGIMAAIGVGFIQTLVVLVWGRDLIRAMAGSHPAVEPLADLGYAYLAFIFLFAPVHCANEAISSVLRAYGDTRTPLAVFAIGFGVNFVLDPFLILGWGPFPRLDILGAAIATNLSFWLVLAIYIRLLARRRLVYCLPEFRPPRVDWAALKRIAKIGLPPSVASLVFSGVFMALSPVVGHFGPEALAALGIGHRIEGVSYLVCYGFSLACVTMVGQNVGAGRLDRAEEAAWSATWMVVGFTAVVSLVFWWVPSPLVSLFTRDPLVHQVGVDYLRIIAASQVFMGVAVVLDGAFAGAGRTLPPMLVSVPATLMRVPAAHLTVFRWGMGISAIWWAISLLTMLRGVIVVVLFRKGLWRGARLEDLGVEPMLDQTPPGPHTLEAGRGEAPRRDPPA